MDGVGGWNLGVCVMWVDGIGSLVSGVGVLHHNVKKLHFPFLETTPLLERLGNSYHI